MTVRINDALLLELKARASRENISLTRLFDRILRAGLKAEQSPRKPKGGYRERTHAMGVPKVDLTKALSLTSALEGGELLRKEQPNK